MVVPGKGDAIELARTKLGRVFEKHLLPYGEFVDPRDTKKKILINEALVDQLIANFSAGVVDTVQAPLVDGKNAHVEDPERNVGEVIALKKGPGGLYAHIDVRKSGVADEVGKTLLGISAMYAEDYLDTRTGKSVGPTLIHAAFTNRPHVLGLEEFRELVAASSDPPDDVVILSEEAEVPQTLEEILADLKDNHKIDVAQLQADLKTAQDAKPSVSADEILAKLSKTLEDSGFVKLSKEESQDADKVLASVGASVKQLGDDNVKLATRVQSLEADKTTAEVDDLIRQGRILPAQREKMIELASTNRSIFDGIVPDKPLVKLSDEKGIDDWQHQSAEDEEAVNKYVAMANGKKE